MRDSERYEAQADTVLRMAARAESAAEKQVYLNIADGWRQLAAEAARNEDRVGPEPRTFHLPDDDEDTPPRRR
ncbi:MAG: hypothetical protein JWQ29_865 [Phenylobacterium sp.]|nr:hypothetical protein [Phenylobacterium sp.]